MAKKYCYLFTEGNAQMRELLGGKGANLAGHFREVCALAAEQLPHLCITFREKGTILFCHECFSS